MNRYPNLLILTSLLILCGCATKQDPRPTYEAIAHRLPPLDAQESRIIFYNNATDKWNQGPYAHPKISIDGELVGRTLQGTFFLVDIPAGKHEVKAYFNALAGTDIQTIELSIGETNYIEVLLIPSFPADIEMVRKLPDDGEKAIMQLRHNDNDGKTLLLPVSR